MVISKKRYLQGFAILVIVLAVIRAVRDERANERTPVAVVEGDSLALAASEDTIQEEEQKALEAWEKAQERKEMKADAKAIEESKARSVSEEASQTDGMVPLKPNEKTRFFNPDGSVARHRIVSVRSYSEAFPDGQDTQILAAQKWGVSPVQNRSEAENRKAELVFVGSNPYFYVEPLYQSIPYLVPRASSVLQDIGRCFFDSLQLKGLPLHRIIITSVMRTKDDVARLRSHNGNATENSCHMYGTTFDIAYNRYLRVEENDSAYSKRRTVADVRLKQILSEVLNDQRKNGNCYVKYEVKQGCFHVTVR